MSDQECRDISFHPEPNALFHLPGYNPCRNPSCRMHACDQGIFKKLLDMVTQQIKLESTSVRTEFENRCQFASPFNCVILFLTCCRWAQLFKLPNYRIFKTGVLNLKMVRAYQHRCMAIGLPYVLNGLLQNQDFLIASIQYVHWRSLLQSARFKESRPSEGDATYGICSLSELQASGTRLQKVMLTLKQSVDDDENAKYAGIRLFITIVHVKPILQRVLNSTKFATGMRQSNCLVPRRITMPKLGSRRIGGTSSAGSGNYNTLILAQ